MTRSFNAFTEKDVDPSFFEALKVETLRPIAFDFFFPEHAYLHTACFFSHIHRLTKNERGGIDIRFVPSPLSMNIKNDFCVHFLKNASSSIMAVNNNELLRIMKDIGLLSKTEKEIIVLPEENPFSDSYQGKTLFLFTSKKEKEKYLLRFSRSLFLQNELSREEKGNRAIKQYLLRMFLRISVTEKQRRITDFLEDYVVTIGHHPTLYLKKNGNYCYYEKAFLSFRRG